MLSQYKNATINNCNYHPHSTNTVQHARLIFPSMLNETIENVNWNNVSRICLYLQMYSNDASCLLHVVGTWEKNSEMWHESLNSLRKI